MNRRDFVKCAGVGAASLATSCWAGSETQAKRPNILFLITDQQTVGALSCAGNPYVKTPNLDRLAARGVRFERSYCTYPLCCPSRGSLFASRMPHELGIYGNFDAELAEKGVPTMGELFSAGGYETAYAGKWHLKAGFPAFVHGKIPGFTVLPLAGKDPTAVDPAKYGKGLTVDPNTADAAITFLGQKHDKPFLLVASILNPHDICEYGLCAPLKQLLPADRAKLPPARPNLHDTETLPSALHQFVSQKGLSTEQQWREYLWAYCRLVEIADAQVGRILDGLEKAALQDNTLVLFTADHGEMMGSHQMMAKQKLYEEAAAVPMIIAAPGEKPALNRQHLVSGLDVLPTLLDYAGLPAPPSLRGVSLRPLVAGSSVPWRDFVVSETVSLANARMVRTARYKYIVFASGEDREQFFDIEQDPGELKNLIAATALAAEVARHRTLLEQWRNDTHDEIGKQPAAPKRRKHKNKNAGGKTDKPVAAGAKPSQDRAVLFDKIDMNHDGKLSLEEYLATKADREAGKKRFERMDTNKDGFLSREQFIQAGGKSK